MPPLNIPLAAVAASLPRNIRPQIATACTEPPAGDSWLHEPKHDGHRLIAITTGDGTLKLVSRNGIDRTALFRAAFLDLAAAGRAMVLDGEIAVPDDRGVTHIDALNDAIGRRRPDALAYFAFDFVYLDGHDPPMLGGLLMSGLVTRMKRSRRSTITTSAAGRTRRSAKLNHY